MSDSVSDNSLFKKLADRDEQAAKRLFERYSRRLSALAEKHISGRLGDRLDGEDVVQSVFRTFFRRSANGEFQIDPNGDLWRLLVTITLVKVRRQARFHQAAKRDINAEESLKTGGWAEEMLNEEPDQLDAMILCEQVQMILKDLPESYTHILSMRLENCTRTEIARHLNISRQTVQHALKTMQVRMQCQESDDL